jgi:hypothetical protein
MLALSVFTSPLLAQRFRPRPAFRFVGPNVSFVSILPANGHFVQSAIGTFNPATRSFVPTVTGATSVLRGQGVFTPVTGTFVPTLNGNFVLTTREAFNTKTGMFVPSATGAFVFSTRGDLVASATGMAVGSFLPFVPFVPLTTTVPVANNRIVVNPYAANPYASGSMNPYMMGMSNPYIAIYPPSSPSRNNAAAMQASNYAAAAAASEATGSARQAAGNYGIPYENGHIKWPLAFRLLPPDMKETLADPLDGQFVTLTTQEANGVVDPALVSGAKRNVARLSGWLTAHRTDMADATYQDGLEFLHTLNDALTKY